MGSYARKCCVLSEILQGRVLQAACPALTAPSGHFNERPLQQGTQISPSFLGQGFYPAFYTNTQGKLWDLA